MSRLHSGSIAGLFASLLIPSLLSAQTFSSHGHATYLAGPIPEDLVIADLDGDLVLDIAVGNSNAGPPGGTDTVSVYLGDGDGTFAAHVQYGVGDRPEGITAGNFDAGGTLDLATADFNGNTVSILLGDGDGTFTAGATVTVPGGPRSIVSGDFDGDGKIDLVTANHGGDSVSFLKGNGMGGFSVEETVGVGNGPEVIAKGRLDGDSTVDLVTANNFDDNLTVLHGDGSGGFTFFTSIPVGDNPRFVKVMDLDGDNFDDILAANHSSNTVTVYKNQAGASFALQDTLSFTGASGPIYIALGDLDDDAIPDCVVTYAMSDLLVVYPGTGGLQFGTGEKIPAGDNTLGIAIADLDDSGHLDLVVTNALDDNVFVYLSAVGSGALVVDNLDPGTVKVGAWSPSGAPDPFGTNSVYAKSSGGPTFTWNATLPAAGTYDVYAWWTQIASRHPMAPYTVNHNGGSALVTVDQRIDGGQWNLLGSFGFSTSASVVLSTNNSAYTVSADAICFVPVSVDNFQPSASITSITPNPATLGESVSFSGTANDPDGTIAAYEWSSSLNGPLSNQASFQTTALSGGTHTIFFRAQDNDGLWSPEDEETLTVNAPGPIHTFVMDNGAPGTSSTGSWLLSGGPNPFGANSLYAKNGPTYTYTFSLAQAGTYEVYAWWTSISTRPASAPHDITHSGGTTTVNVNQQVNGGQWNLLGTFSFGATAIVRIRAVGTASTNADAICLSLVGEANDPPVATIDSIAPNPATAGESVTFTGHGTDPEGGAITGHEWRSSIDGPLSTLASFSSSTLSAGSHTIFYRVKDDQDLWSSEASQGLQVNGGGGGTVLIIDNGQPGTSFTGGWTVSGGPDPFGTNSLYAKNGPTYTYTFLTSPGSYEVRAWWTEWPSRSTNVPIDITHSGGTTTVFVNQKVDGGQWNGLGTFDFGSTAVIKITAVGQDTTNADAISLVSAGGPPPPPQEVIIDNGQPGTSFTGGWSVSGGPNPFGTNSLYARNGPTYSYTTNITGTFNVYAWWTQWPSRSTSAPHDITHSGGTTTVNVNQQVNGGQWNLLGTFTFNGQGIVTIRSIGDPTTCADAVRFQPVP